MTGLEQAAPEKETQPVEMPDDEVLYELADLFRVFGDSTRIKILYALHDSELCVQDIADAVQLSQSAVSHQLRVLKDSKLVRFRREGKTVFYALDDDHVRSILPWGWTISKNDRAHARRKKRLVLIMKKTYKIEVDCANCAQKMEDAANTVAGVEKATVSFMTQKMKVEFAEGADPHDTMENVLSACKKVEDDCEIFDI